MKTIGIMSVCLSMLMFSNTLILENDSKSQLGRTCNWSPYITEEEVVGFSESARMRSDFYFDSDSLDIICNSDLAYCFTFEHCATEGTPVSLSDHYSNLPDPVFDVDDDDGDGYDEEAEVTCGSRDDMVVDKSYYYATWWSKPSTMPQGNIDSRGQMSLKIGEYQAMASDLYSYNTWVYPPNSSKIGHQPTKAFGKNVDYGTELSESQYAGKNHRVKLLDSIDSLEDIEAYRNAIMQNYSAVVPEVAQYSEIDTTSERTNAVITFSAPVSIDYLKTLLDENCELVNYEAKFTNGAGEWQTLCSVRLSEDDAIAVAKELSGESELTYWGITSATVSISPYDETYENLISESEIYLVDMSEHIARVENNDPSLTMTVSDCYYMLEKYGGTIVK